MIDLHKTYKIDELEVKSRISQILEKGLTNIPLIEGYKKILSFIDLTTLEGSDTNEKVIGVCEKAKSYENIEKGIENVAAVCFYPVFAKLAHENLKGSGINIACVAGAFPSGQSPLDVRLAEVKFAAENGADEIDMVISRGKFLEGDFQYVYDEIVAHKKACGNAHLKVILETGELGSLSNIRKASDIAIDAGADFIKTSTGKISPAATLEAFIVMLDAIKEHYEKTGKMIGIKPAGGISEPETAIEFLTVLQSVLGDKWLNKNYFRIGASRLADKIHSLIK
ncbi:MAG: deoxyribose-phosphate aldolase [Saprospiraceae bacterium]|nr:deoxyribose-phosphate aldolase [Saprospiraceae bacterium]